MTRLRDVFQREPKPGFRWPPWLDRLLCLGIVSTDSEVIRRQRCVNVALAVIAVSAFSHFVTNALHDFRGLLPVNIYNFFTIVIALLMPLLHRVNENAAAIVLGIAIAFGHSFVVWSFGLASELQVYFTLGPSVLLLMFGIQNWRIFIAFVFLYLGALLVALNFAPIEGLLIPEDDKFRDVLSTQAMINTHCDQRRDFVLRALCVAERGGRTPDPARTVGSADRDDDAAADRRPTEVGRAAHCRPDRDAERDVHRSRRTSPRRRTISRPRRWSSSSTVWCEPATSFARSTASRRSRRSATAIWRRPDSPVCRPTAPPRSGVLHWR